MHAGEVRLGHGDGQGASLRARTRARGQSERLPGALRNAVAARLLRAPGSVVAPFVSNVGSPYGRVARGPAREADVPAAPRQASLSGSDRVPSDLGGAGVRAASAR